MKLLVLTHRLPCPPDRGAKLRAAAELRWLTARHEVWCGGFIDPPQSRQERAATAASLADLCRFRNVLAHEGDRIDAAVVVEVLRHGVRDLRRFSEAASGW